MDNKLSQEHGSFSTFNTYYDLFYRDKPYQQETMYIHSLLQQHVNKPIELLELGAGTGNYSKYLCNAGYQVTGIEKSAEMLSVAISKDIPGFYPVEDDMITFSIDRKFDAVVSLFHVISYLTKNSDILSCFSKVAKHLKPNGIFIFDTWYTPAVYDIGPETRVKRIVTADGEVLRIAEPTLLYEKNVVQVDYTLVVQSNHSATHKILKETHFMRHFSTTEIAMLAELSGLRLIQSEEFLTRKEPSGETWGVCFILKKDE